MYGIGTASMSLDLFGREVGLRLLTYTRRHFADGVVFYKYWKPAGVLSTTAIDVDHGIFRSGLKSREALQMFSQHAAESAPLITVGRLDKASTGLLLLTNSESVSTELLRTYHPAGTISSGDIALEPASVGCNKIYGSKYEKIYLVVPHREVTLEEINILREGVEITTLGRRKGAQKRKRRTLPCKVHRLADIPAYSAFCEAGQSKEKTLVFHLREGRNRQIRKMLGSLGNGAVLIHRVSFGGITLSGLLGPGHLIRLTDEELQNIHSG